MTSNDDESLFIMDGIELFPSSKESLPLKGGKDTVQNSSLSTSMTDDSSSSDEDSSLFCSTGIVKQPNNSVGCTSFSENTTRATTSTSRVYAQDSNTEDYFQDHKTGKKRTFESVRMDFHKTCNDIKMDNNYLKVLALNAADKMKNSIKNSSGHSDFTTCKNIKDLKMAETLPNKELPPKVIFPNILKNQHHLKKAVIVLPKVSENMVLQATKCNGIKIPDEKKMSSSVTEETKRKTIRLNGIDHNAELHMKNAFVKLDILPDIAIKKEKIVVTNGSSIGAKEYLEHKKANDSFIKLNILPDNAIKKDKILETNGSSIGAEEYLEQKKANDSIIKLNNVTDIANKKENILESNISSMIRELEREKSKDATIMNIGTVVPEEEGKVVNSGDSAFKKYSTNLNMGNPFVKIHNFPLVNTVFNKTYSLNLKENGVNLDHQSLKSSSNIKERIDSTIERLMKRDSIANEETDITFVEEKNLREEADKTRETHTVEDADSDSEIFIINENISSKANISSGKVRGRGRGRGRPPGSMKRYGFGNRNGFTNNQNYFGSKILKCSECNFKTQYLRQLQDHEAAHPKGRKMKCSLCTFETRIKSCMMYHAVIHSGGKKFKCSKCNFKTNNIEVFINHEKKKTFCPKCKEDCHTKVGLNRHLRDSHNVDIYECHFCSFLTADAGEMEAHKHDASFLKPRIKRIRKTQSSDYKFVCTECRFPAQSLTLLEEHLKDVHDIDMNDIKVEQRNGSFHQSSSELSKNEAKPRVTAVNINKRLPGKPGRKRSLKRNVGRKDIRKYKKTSFGEFICLKCNFVTDDIVYLKNHLEIHDKRASVFSENKDIFKCIFCQFETEYEKMMESHMETHTEQDSDFDFDNDSPLKKERNVSGADGIGVVQCVEEKKYKCSCCDFQSNYIKPFERHKSLHLRKDVFDIIFSSIIL